MTTVALSARWSLVTPVATIRRASMSSPESVSSRIASFGSSIAIWKISFFFFSPPEKPSFTAREVSFDESSTTALFSRMSFRNSAAESGSSPRNLRCSLTASFIKLAIVTPGISTGYWKPRNSPSRARSSMGIDSRSRPRNSADPSVTVNFSLPASTDASVDLPEPLGPMMACTSPALTSRSIPRRISLPSTEACKLCTFNISSTYYYSRFLFSLSQVVSTAFRRVCKPDPTLNPFLGRGLSHATGLQTQTANYPTLPSNWRASSFCASTANSIGSLASTSRA